MSIPLTLKYGFRIRTSHGLLMEHLSIIAGDEAEAERKLRQMYRHCQILECNVLQSGRQADSLSIEDGVSLISK